MFSKSLTGLGIDITENEVRVAHASRFGKILSLHAIPVPPGVIHDERVADEAQFLAAVEDGFKTISFSTLPLCTTILIPESRVFSSCFSIPDVLNADNQQRMFLKHAQKDIPIPESQAAWFLEQDHVSVSKLFQTCAYAVEKSILKGFASGFPLTRSEPLIAEPKSAAFVRLLHRAGVSGNHQNVADVIGLIDPGSNWTTISIYSKTGINLISRSLAVPKNSSSNTEDFAQMILGTFEELGAYMKVLGKELHAYVLVGDLSAYAGLAEKLSVSQSAVSIHTISDAVPMKSVSKEDVERFGAAIGAAFRSASGQHHLSISNFQSKK